MSARLSMAIIASVPGQRNVIPALSALVADEDRKGNKVDRQIRR
jgi:hypothetical protein